jgi:aryl-alcohol dehydrogenase-like predicted oxidoreductase
VLAEASAQRPLASHPYHPTPTPAQIAFAWVLARKPWIEPIRGTPRMERLEENIGATTVKLTAHDLRAIDAAAALEVQGAGGSGHERYM